MGELIRTGDLQPNHLRGQWFIQYATRLTSFAYEAMARAVLAPEKSPRRL